MKITVLHNISRDASFGLNAVFDLTQKAKKHEPRSHELVKVYEFVTSDLLSAEDIFYTFNVGDDPALARDERQLSLARAYRARKLRSLSVGDVLIFEGEAALACESAGWRVVAPDELHVLDEAEATRAVRERYEFRKYEDLSITVPLHEHTS